MNIETPEGSPFHLEVKVAEGGPIVLLEFADDFDAVRLDLGKEMFIDPFPSQLSSRTDWLSGHIARRVKQEVDLF